MSHLTAPTADCFVGFYVNEIRDLQQEIAALRSWSPSAARDELIAAREERIEELELCMEFGGAIEAYRAEVIEIASPSQQLAEIAADLREELPAVRWTVASGGIIGCIAALQIALSRSGRGWKGDLRTTVWSAFEGEVVVILSAASASSARTVAQLLVTAAAVRREQVAA
jgi:hypothetical protein